MLMYASFCSWFGYGLRTESISQMLTNGIALLLGAWLLHALLAGWRWRWPFLITVPVMAPAIIMGIPLPAMSLVLLGFSVTRWPQVMRSYRAWREHTPTPAVSGASWMLSMLSAGLWLLYGFLDGRGLVMLTSTIGLVAAVLIVLFTRLATPPQPERAHDRPAVGPRP